MSFSKSFAVFLLASAAPVYAQEATAPANQPQAEQLAPAEAEASAEAPPQDAAGEDEEEEGEAIVVTGQRLRGAVDTDIPAEIQLDSRDVRALGAGSLAEVLEALQPQTQSGRGRGEGRPILLLNGRRISGFQEIRNIPPEAIQRIDILPEEVALQYGYRADQRVVNFVLRRRFNAVTTEAETGFATDGGRSRYEADFNLLRIDPAGRWEIDAEYSHEAPLFESERDLDTDLAAYRTLLPETDNLELAGTLNRTIFNDVSATVNATFDVTRNESRFGLAFPDAPSPLSRETDSRNGHLGFALNGDVKPWRWSFTGNYDRGHSTSRIDRRDAFGLQDRGRTETETANAEFVASGDILALPAGGVSTTLRAGLERQALESRATRLGIASESDLSRSRGSIQGNINIPIASRRNDVLAALGNLSANFNAELEQYSDFGTLRTLGGGLNWSPIAEVSLIASVTDEEGAATMQQLGNPVLATPNVRVFDFTRGETVDVTRIEGGTPDLVADQRRVLKLGATVRPAGETDLSITANYTNTRTRNAIASFPTATPEIEAAFPDRFERDADGRLLRIDSRPVNFERTDRQELRWGVNFSKPIKSARPPREAFPQRWRQRRGEGQGQGRPDGGSAPAAPASPGAAPGTAPPAAAGAAPSPEGGRPVTGQGEARPEGGGRRWGGGQGGFGDWGGRGGFGRGGRGQGGRLQFALYHTWRLEDSVLIREGVPELDFLNGSAAGNRGGRPRHELEAQAGIFKNGYGARLTANWLSGTEVRGVPGTGGSTSSDLFFSDYATVNLRLFANLGEQQWVKEYPWLRGTRVTLAVNNLLNARPDVRDAAGVTPLGYRPDELDPLGRSVNLSIRKLFF